MLACANSFNDNTSGRLVGEYNRCESEAIQFASNYEINDL